MIYTSVGAFCAAIWLLLSGYYNPLLLSLGLASCVLVVWLSQRMRLLDADLPSATLVMRFMLYIPWIMWEISKANIDVIKRILDPALPISPTLIRVKSSQRGDLARVIFANSITLTPGTVAVQVEDDFIAVHALSQETADELSSGVMDRRVSRLENQ